MRSRGWRCGSDMPVRSLDLRRGRSRRWRLLWVCLGIGGGGGGRCGGIWGWKEREGIRGWEEGGLPATRRLNMFWPLEESACSSAADAHAASMLMSAPAMKFPGVRVTPSAVRDTPSAVRDTPSRSAAARRARRRACNSCAGQDTPGLQYCNTLDVPFLDETSTAARTVLSLSTAFIAA